MNPVVGEQRERVAAILHDPYTMATVLYAIALRQYGHEVHDWEPETVFLELEDDFGQGIPPVNHDKLMALLSAVSSNTFYTNPGAFRAICHSLSGDEEPWDFEDPLLVAEMAWGVLEVEINDDTTALWSDDVKAMVGGLLLEEGFVEPPPHLDFARIPAKYEGSSTTADLGRERTLSTEHAKVVQEYILDQAATLIRQISALPWHSEDTLKELVDELQKSRSGSAPPQLLG